MNGTTLRKKNTKRQALSSNLNDLVHMRIYGSLSYLSTSIRKYRVIATALQCLYIYI